MAGDAKVQKNLAELEALKNKAMDPTNMDHSAIQDQKTKEALAALGEGKLPSTAQTVDAIDQFQKSTAAGAPSTLSLEGQKIALDSQKILNTTKNVLIEKNSQDQIQKMIYHGENASARFTDLAADKSIDPETHKLLADLQTSSKVSLKKLTETSQIIITSKEFRSCLSDLTVIFRDIFQREVVPQTGETGQKVINASKNQKEYTKDATSQSGPESDQLVAGARTRANDAVSHSQQAGRDSANVAQQVSSGDKTVRDGLHNHVDIAADALNKVVPKDVQDVAGHVAAKGANQAGVYVDKVNAGETDATGAIKMAGMDLKDSATNVYQNTEITKSDKTKIENRIQRAILRLQDRSDYSSSMGYLIDLITHMNTRTQQLKSKLKGHALELMDKVDYEIQQVQLNAKQLIENFAGGRSLDTLIAQVTSLSSDVSRDPQIQAYLTKASEFMKAALLDKKFVAKTDFRQLTSELIDQGRALTSNKYGPRFDALNAEATAYLEALSKDDRTNELSTGIKKLVNDMVLDDAGNPTIKASLVGDLMKVIPKVADYIAFLPIPRIESEDEDVLFIADNILIKCANLLPSFIEIRTDTRMDTTRSDKQQMIQVVDFKASRIQASARDIAFMFNKKKGIIAPSDVGLVDFDIKDDGLSIKILFEPIVGAITPNAQNVAASLFRVRDVDCNISGFSLKLHDTHHDTLYALITPLIKKNLTSKIEKLIAQNVKEQIESFGDKIHAAAASNSSASADNLNRNVDSRWGSNNFNVDK